MTDVFQSSLEQVVAAKLPSELPLTEPRSIARRTLHALKHIWPKEYGLNHVWKEQSPTGINKVTTPLSFISHHSRESELKVGILVEMIGIVEADMRLGSHSFSFSFPLFCLWECSVSLFFEDTKATQRSHSTHLIAAEQTRQVRLP